MHYFPDDNNPTRALQGDGEYWLVVGWVVVDIGSWINLVVASQYPLVTIRLPLSSITLNNHGILVLQDDLSVNN